MKITLIENQGNVSFKSSEACTIDQLFQIAFTAILGAMNQQVAAQPTGHREEAKAAIYDLLNLAASRTLELFAPEYELRPNLTAQAILEAENRIINEDRLSSVEPGT